MCVKSVFCVHKRSFGETDGGCFWLNFFTFQQKLAPHVFERFCPLCVSSPATMNLEDTARHRRQAFVCSDCIFLIAFCSFPGLQHIKQDDRVSMGIDGNLYFSNALQKDSRKDYCCFAAFQRIRTIVQKDAMAVVVKSCRFTKLSAWLDCTTVAHVFVMRSRTDVWGVRIQRDDTNHYRPLCFFQRSSKTVFAWISSYLLSIVKYQEAWLDLSSWSSGKLFYEAGLSNKCLWRQPSLPPWVFFFCLSFQWTLAMNLMTTLMPVSDITQQRLHRNQIKTCFRLCEQAK